MSIAKRIGTIGTYWGRTPIRVRPPARYEKTVQPIARGSLWERDIPFGIVAALVLLAFVLGCVVNGAALRLNPFATEHPAETPVAKLMIWLAAFAIISGCRQPLREMLEARRASPLLLAALAFVPVTLVDIGASWFAVAISGYPTCAPGALPLPTLSSFLPRSMFLGAALLGAMTALSRHLASHRAEPPAKSVPSPAETSPRSGEWLDLPEAPLLHLRTKDVVLIRSAGNYSEIVAAGRTYLVRVTLAQLADRFGPLGFVRVHRQTLVNGRHVKEIYRQPGGRPVIHLYGDIFVPLGRRYLDAVRALIS